MADEVTSAPPRPRVRPSAASRKPAKGQAHLVPSLHFTRKNMLFFGIALAVLLLGYVLLAAGNMDLASVLLVVGYLVLVPLSIVVK